MYKYNDKEYEKHNEFLEVRRSHYFEMINGGINSTQACKIVGVSKRTGKAWRNGRTRSSGRSEMSYVTWYTENMRNQQVYDSYFLSEKDRLDIADYMIRGLSMRQIAKIMGRSHTTISREIKRNSEPKKAYSPHNAHSKSRKRGARPKQRKIEKYPELLEFIKEKLKLHWSPEQIAKEWNRKCDTEDMKISPESIYQAIYVQAKGELKLEIKKALRTGRVRRVKRGSRNNQQRFREPMINISQRPPEVEDRAIPGHWEGDLITGAYNKTAIGTIVERSTRFALLLHLPNGHGAKQVQDAIIERFRDIPEVLRKSLTWDQGAELAFHKKITTETNLDVYFCDPHSPWQRGTNENTNRLFRDWFPKGTDLSVHSREYLKQVEKELNQRPRKTLDWKTPEEKIQEIANVLYFK